MPPSVITTINGYTKVFIGNLIERAREVQQQHAKAEVTLPSPTPSSTQDPPVHGGGEPNSSFPNEGPPNTIKKNNDLGPLLPGHLREALRRYKRDGEGGGAGLAGVSLGLGVPGAGAARLGGKRLFR